MKRNKKLTIIALSVLLVMTLAATVVSFSLANRGRRSNAPDGVDLVAENTGKTLTNIDYIVKATATADADPYIVVEIGSKKTTALTTFGSFASEGDFREFVINGNKTIDDMEMAEGKVEYKYFYAGDVTEDNAEALAYIASADFIYVSAADPYSKAAGNDMGEDLYNILHVAAVGDYKPFIIDKPSSAGSSDVFEDEEELKFSDLAKNYLSKVGYQYNTYFWDEGSVADATDFFSGAVGSGSYYAALSGRARSVYWTTVKPAADSEDQFDMAEMLVISSKGTSISSNGDMLSKVLSGNKGEATGLYVVSSETAAEELVVEDNQKVYSIDSTTPLYTNGYSKRYSQKPEYVRVTEVTLAELDSDEYVSFDFTPYDIVVIEDDCGSTVISSDLYKRLVALMYANTHIIYDYALGSASTDPGTGGGSTTTDADTNYQELYNMVATEDDIARYQNIMVTDATKLNVIATSKSAATCKIIADLINAASFRGIGGPGSTSSTFTVLEIQPCYPIDTVIAEKNGKYYDMPSEVINGKTKEQIGIEVVQDADGDWITDASKIDKDVPEYYAWELSEAKVADALGKNVNEVKVVHMSSEEFATNKEAVLGTYDMVYIGGNTSALKQATEWNSLKALHGEYRGTNVALDKLAQLPIYVMYTHTGDMVKNVLSVEEGPVQKGSPINAAPGKTSDQTFVTMSGNDITYTGLLELQKFVDAKMPVIISQDVYNVYYPFIKEARDNGGNPYLQNSIDPESNMCLFLDYCVDKSSVLWGLDVTDTEYVDNDGGALGDTLTGKVEVFVGKDKDDANAADRAKDQFFNIYNTSNKRPKLAVTSMPAVYNVYDPSTKTPSLNLTYKFDVTGVSNDYTVNLYVDYDKNSIFVENEIIATTSSATTISANLANIDKYGPTHSGPVYWKLEIVDNANGAAVSTSKLAYIQPPEPSKKTIRVLQILPDESIQGAYGANSWVSLIFCTECQRAIEILDYNPGYEGNLYDGNYANLYDGKVGDHLLDGNGAFNGIYTGRHQHNFGVVRYDSATTVDDWYYNYADDISDMFDFEIDIMTSRDFEAATDAVNSDLAAYLTANYNGRALADLTEDEIDDLKADLQELASDAQADYEELETLEDIIFDNYEGRTFEQLSAAEKTVLGASLTGSNNELALAEFNLLTYIEERKAVATGTEKTALDNIYESRMYSDYIISFSNNRFASYDDYKKYYESYAKALDVKLSFKDKYDEANRLANYENWLLGCYESVIIGPAESFCGDDIKTEAAIDVLEGYVSGDGHTLLFHDTLTKYSDAGAYNLTMALIDYYGMDKNHAELDESKAKDETITAEVDTIKNGGWMQPAFNLTIDGNTIPCNASIDYTKDSHNVTLTWPTWSTGYITNCQVANDANTLTGAGEVAFNINIVKEVSVNYNSVPYPVANTEVTFTMSDGTLTATGTTDANGNVTFSVPNFETKTVTTEYKADDMWYLPYKLKDGYTSPRYTLPNISTRPVSDATRYHSWISDMGQVFEKVSWNGKKYYSPLYAYTDSLNLGHNDNEPASPYKYATVDWHACTQNGYQALVATLGSNKASKTNKGIVTMYPFNLSDELNIAPTHAQAYALDLANDNLSVWYTIGGGSNNKDASEMQAATPHDGTDNYFIYTVGNLNYCGAGHTKVTGQNKDNNDERMLYINIIANSVTNIAQTSINAYDYDTTKQGVKNNNVVKKQGNEYVIKLDDNDNVPEFMFDFDLGKGATLSRVNVFFDIDGDGKFTSVKEGEDPIDRYILQTNAMAEGALCYLPIDFQNADAVKSLTINPETDLTNGKYVYIVIEVIDTEGNKTRKKIKVEYKDKLYNLT